MKNTMKFIAAALIFALALSVFMTVAFAGETETEAVTEAVTETVTETEAVTEAVTETEAATETEAVTAAPEEFTAPDAPEGLNEEGQNLWNKFWDAVISMMNGTTARDAVVTVCSILVAVIAILGKNAIAKFVQKIIETLTASNKKTNEIIGEINENSAAITALEEKCEKRFADIYDKCLVAAEKTSEKDARVEVTNDAVLALAGMLNTIFTSSSTIPDAAKEIIREKYAGVLHAVNKINEAGERLTEESDIVKAE